jgi:hypothetical protein
MIINGSTAPNSFATTWMRLKFYLQTKKATLRNKQEIGTIMIITSFGQVSNDWPHKETKARN